jgi:lysozyme
MQTSARGIAALELEEGVVLKAYRCPAGIWTIGPGLTAGSGVVKPKAGMVITRDEATSLLTKALERNYEPRVRKHLRGLRGSAVITPRQHEFDAGLSFDFNTGQIHKAGWVKRWIEGAAPAVIRKALALWNKGGGKVLPGLVARRRREANMLLLAQYPVPLREIERLDWASWGLALTANEKAAAREAMRKLGYPVGAAPDAITRRAVETFQRDHDLTVDGIIGRATLSTLQRRIDAPAKVAPALGGAGAAGAGSATGAFEAVSVPPGGDWLILGACGAFALWSLWRYRDAVAAHLNHPLPRIAAFLRSF